jgi:hypothetical protein
MYSSRVLAALYVESGSNNVYMHVVQPWTFTATSAYENDTGTVAI